MRRKLTALVIVVGGFIFASASWGCDPEARQARKDLKHTTPAMRAAAVKKLARTEGKSAIKEIGPLINDRSPGVRLAVVKALRQLKSKKVLRYLQTAVRDVDPEVRLSAVRGLGELKDKRAVPVLLTRFQDHNTVVRRAARIALLNMGVDRAQQVAFLAKRARNRWVALSASNRATATRVDALRALSLNGREENVEILARALRASDVEVVEAAAVGLGRMGGAKAETLLVKALASPTPRVRAAVERGIIERIQRHPPGEWTIKRLEGSSRLVKLAALETLTRAAREGNKDLLGALSKMQVCRLLGASHLKVAIEAAKLAKALKLTCPWGELVKDARERKTPGGAENNGEESRATPPRKTKPEKTKPEKAKPRKAAQRGTAPQEGGANSKKEAQTPPGFEEPKGFRPLWVKAMVVGELTAAERRRAARLAEKLTLHGAWARAFAALEAPEIHKAVKEHVQALYERYVYESRRWVDEDEWRSLEKDGRAKDLGPKIRPPSDPKAQQIKKLLARFPSRPKTPLRLLPPRLSPKEVGRGLRYLGHYENTRSFLAKVAFEGPPELRPAALEGLGGRRFKETPSSEVVAAVKEAVSGDVEARVAATKVLGAMGRYGFSVLVQLLARDPLGEVREAAAAALARTGLAAAREPLRNRGREKLTLAVIRALRKLDDPLAVPLFLKRLKKTPIRGLLEERVALIQAVGELGEAKKEIVSTLVEELDHPHWAVRSAAAKSLGQLKAEEAREGLEARTTDFYRPVRRACREALERIGGKRDRASRAGSR